MKTKLTLLLTLLIVGLSNAQDSLRVDSITPLFTSNTTFKIGDSLNFEVNYTPNFGYNAGVNYMMAIKENGNYSNEVQSILPAPNTVDSLEPSVSKNVPVVFLAPAMMKNGNNTVVIWPETTDHKEQTIDKDKLVTNTVLIVSEDAVGEVIIEELITLNYSYGKYTVTSKLNNSLLVQLVDLNGKVISNENLSFKGASAALYPKTNGVYFIKINSDQVHASQKIIFIK